MILDRDPLYTGAFRRLLRDSGVTPFVLPARSPSLMSVKSECLDRIVLLVVFLGGYMDRGPEVQTHKAMI